MTGVLATAPLDFAGSSLAWSPYDEGRLAVATAANFGIVGNGAQLVLDVRAGQRAVLPVARLVTNDGLSDCAWSETHEHHLASACSDGSLKLWDLQLAAAHGGRPLAAVRAHDAEACGVDWSSLQKHLLATCGWDRAVKVWNAETLQAPVTVLAVAEPGPREVHDVRWAPHTAGTLASAAADRTARVWALNTGRAEVVLGAHDADVLSVDWHKYNPSVLATGGVDRLIRLWDLRRPAAPLSVLRGHRLAVRRVRFSPHDERLLLSCSYDMSAAVWDAAGPPGAPALATYAHHTEFVVGAEWALFEPGLFATCGWDGTLALAQAPPPPPHNV
ncbi:WD40-repeat-containing domain protein [Pavlovales sp. CCMP2436]|nr:WD40-repeat-containing domain protein [Pavlovales sp. CCMP2436]|mmetsp:Transcript_33663/g.79240  ORF Transcript_33663/g.79240 Transcript_33663/m.79240 type:complete len:331 (-) Transcript_33663:78-1070(-)